MIYDIMETEWETFHRLFPKATKEEWEELQLVSYIMIQEEVQKYGQNVSTFRHVWIDEEFFEWSKNIRSLYKEPNIALTELYMNNLSDEEVIRLYAKNEHGWETELFLLPIAMYTLDNQIPRSIGLEQKIRSEIQRIISSHFKTKKENVYVNNSFVRMDDYFECLDEHFEEKAFRYFSKGNEVIQKFELPSRPNGRSNAALRVLPIAIKTKTEPILTWKEVVEKKFPEQNMIKQKNMNNLCEQLKQTFKDKYYFDLYRFVLEEEECFDFAEDFYSFAKKETIVQRFQQKQGKMLSKAKTFS